MKTNFFKIISLFGIAAVFFQCGTNSIPKDELGWTSNNPLSIPLEIRKDVFDQGNLVTNESFEDGSGSAITGWTMVGENVTWYSSESENGDKEVSEGVRSVKIYREKADELAESEGVISDFIPVIPGNYSLYYDIRLGKIISHKFETGSKIDDGIDVRIFYYDKNKKQLRNNHYYPYKEYNLDNSFKAYPFSNFWNIQQFDWGRVNGKTRNYPFSDGDINDSCRYVKLFFGLKAIGTMWVDNIDYRMSKWNFTTLERLQPYFEKELTVKERLFPTPKRVSDITPIAIQKALIIIPEKPADQEKAAARILQEKLGADVEITSIVSEISDMLVFNIGETSLNIKYKESLPYDDIIGKDQGYFIKKANDKEIIFLTGNNPEGSYYAVATAIQLIEENTFHYAEIIDYPDFEGRMYGSGVWKTEEELNNDLGSIERMSLYKLNLVYRSYVEIGQGNKWFEPSDIYTKGVRETIKKCNENGIVGYMTMINPYVHLSYESLQDTLSDDLRYVYTHSDKRSMDRLKKAFKVALDAGGAGILHLADDFVPHEGSWSIYENQKQFALYTDEDRKEFGNLAFAQAHVINEIYDWMKRNYPDSRYEFCPPWYLNRFIDVSHGKAERYFKELMRNIPADVAIIWTGGDVRTLTIDAASIHRYAKQIGRYPMLWDNTLYARSLNGVYGGYPMYYPYKARMCNLFEPFETETPKDFHKFNDRNLYVNGSAYPEVYKIKFATVADYGWNCNDYNADLSMWKALVNQFGKEAAIKLLEFNDAYFGLISICRVIEIDGLSQELKTSAEDFSNKLKTSLKDISKMLQNEQKLIKELKVHLKNQERVYGSI